MSKMCWMTTELLWLTTCSTNHRAGSHVSRFWREFLASIQSASKRDQFFPLSLSLHCTVCISSKSIAVCVNNLQSSVHVLFASQLLSVSVSAQTTHASCPCSAVHRSARPDQLNPIAGDRWTKEKLRLQIFQGCEWKCVWQEGRSLQIGSKT